MKVNIVLFLFLCFSQSCLRKLPDEKLTMKQIPYNGYEIKTNGCFISDTFGNNLCTYLFFYKNGVNFGLSDRANINNINQFTGGIDSYRNHKGSWGLFQVENNLLTIQEWQSSVDTIQYIIYNKTFKISNDTTLVIQNDSYIRYYHFAKFSPKPDSTNVFIK